MTPFVLTILLVAVKLYIPLAVYDDEAKCKDILATFEKSTDKFNVEVQVGCIDKVIIDKMQKRDTPDKKDDKPSGEKPATPDQDL